MGIENNPNFEEEVERLNYTIDYVNKTLSNAIRKKEHVESELSASRKHADVDSSQAYIDLMINTMFKDKIQTKLKNLVYAQKKPYFARMDFREGDKPFIEKLYIGKMALLRDEDQELIIVDWRAPIANLYYEGRLGEAFYDCPDGKIEGKILLKRQFTIDNGKLYDMFDIDITTNDEFLQKYLGANADNRLKDIVSTIQVDQNKIIRSDMWKPLIIQGAAGSGKTTIALHRIAYLIYTYEKSFEPENFMIIAPTKFFLNYISDVLPELGVDRVKQTTFEEFSMELIGKKFKLKDSNEKLTWFVDRNETLEDIESNNMIRKESNFKSSMKFKEILDDYIKIIEKSFVPKEDFKIESYVIYTYEEINKLFIEDYKNLSMAKRLNEIKKHLTNRLKSRRNYILGKIQLDCDRRIKHLKQVMDECEERHQLIVETIDKKNDLISKIDKLSKSAVKDYMSRISQLDPFEYYKKLIMDKKYFLTVAGDRVEEKLINYICDYSSDVINSGSIETEDLAPIIYIKYCIHGINEKIPVRHIVIDEAQDFSVFQLYVLKKIVKDSSFTILGDLCQGIYSYRGVNSWDDVKKYVFEGVMCEQITLKESYRTTVEIMEAANKVISRIDELVPYKGSPVIRHGKKIEIIKKDNLKGIVEDIDKKISKLKSENFKSIAIICKTMEECKKIYSYFKKRENKPNIITGKEKEYKGGLVILPSYYAKGLEFDVVFIANVSEKSYMENELDIKLLYVAMTRALHSLYTYYIDEPSVLLETINN